MCTPHKDPHICRINELRIRYTHRYASVRDEPFSVQLRGGKIRENVRSELTGTSVSVGCAVSRMDDSSRTDFDNSDILSRRQHDGRGGLKQITLRVDRNVRTWCSFSRSKRRAKSSSLSDASPCHIEGSYQDSSKDKCEQKQGQNLRANQALRSFLAMERSKARQANLARWWDVRAQGTLTRICSAVTAETSLVRRCRRRCHQIAEQRTMSSATAPIVTPITSSKSIASTAVSDSDKCGRSKSQTSKHDL